MPFDWTPHKGGTWSAESIGDRIEGRVVAIENRKTRDGDVPVVTLRDSAGIPHDVWCGTDLRSKLADLEPQVGDALQITLTELKNTGQPKKLKVFQVRHKRASELGDGAAPTQPQPSNRPNPMVSETGQRSTVTADDLAEQRDNEEPF